MGLFSRGQSSTPTKTLTDKPWRWFKDYGNLEGKLKEDIRKLRPEVKPNVLLIGSVGAGKSSFINSCLSVSAGRRVVSALTGFTVKCKTYTDDRLLVNFNLTDCMGLGTKDQDGLNLEDISFLINGHIMNGYAFHPYSTISDASKFYRAEPTLENKIHFVVFVVDANVICTGIQPSFFNKIRELQGRIKKAEIPRAMILTKADILCEKVKDKADRVFRSIKVLEAVNKASEIFGIEKASIHPVVNYETEFELTNEKNVPLLLAMREILQYTTDKVQNDLNLNAENWVSCYLRSNNSNL